MSRMIFLKTSITSSTLIEVFNEHTPHPISIPTALGITIFLVANTVPIGTPLPAERQALVQYA